MTKIPDHRNNRQTAFTLNQLIVSAVWANKRITAQYASTESCAMFWREFCPGHRIFCIERRLYLHINSFRNAFAWLNDTIRTDPGVMFNIQHRLLQSCLSIYFILRQYAKLFCQVITELFILCTRIGTHNKCQKYGMHFLATPSVVITRWWQYLISLLLHSH